MQLKFTLETASGQAPLAARIDELVIAGWTARDVDAMEAHISELEAIGVPRPRETPTYYRVGSSLLTTAGEIEVSGSTSSGEVEFVILNLEGTLYVGLGSDHTDREAEKAGVALSKQLCPKPLCPRLWSYDEVAGHWDALVLRSHAVDGAAKRLYQEGPVTTMRAPLELLGNYSGGPAAGANLAMFCGTLTVHGPVAGAARFEMELEDPVLGRRLAHAYDTTELPVAG